MPGGSAGKSWRRGGSTAHTTMLAERKAVVYRFQDIKVKKALGQRSTGARLPQALKDIGFRVSLKTFPVLAGGLEPHQ
eukprot:1158952-Pelagomonas_calceolata.AAC.4